MGRCTSTVSKTKELEEALWGMARERIDSCVLEAGFRAWLTMERCPAVYEKISRKSSPARGSHTSCGCLRFKWVQY